MYRILRTYFRGNALTAQAASEGTANNFEQNRAPTRLVGLWEEEQTRSSSICRANSYDKLIASCESSYGGEEAPEWRFDSECLA